MQNALSRMGAIMNPSPHVSATIAPDRITAEDVL